MRFSNFSVRSNDRALKKMLIILGAIVVISGIGIVIGARQYFTTNLKPVGGSQQSKNITIPSGYSLKQTSALLKSEGMIRNGNVFEQYVRSVDASDKIKAGTYELSPQYSVQEIVTIITEGKVKTNFVTILPGQSLSGVKKALKNAGYDEAEIARALDPASYPDHPALVDKPKNASLEGYLYPETFQKTTETRPEEIVKKSLDEMNKRLTADLRQKIANQGLSVYQGVILSSIVEREVSKPEDRKQVAQVFLKRLRDGMALESDATASYGALMDGKLEGLGYSQTLQYQSSYNTYQNKGLPPGPISNVSETSLQAVAEPAATDWVYFVSGDDGRTWFSKTLAEHQKYTNEYCKKLCQ